MSPISADFDLDFDRPSSSRHEDSWIHGRVHRRIENNLEPYLHDPGDIRDRLESLEREWSVEKMIALQAGTWTLAGLALGLRDRRWLALPTLAGVSLLQFGLLGWSFSLLGLRMMGFRTRREIDDERSALKIIRGDYAGLSLRQSPGDLLHAVERN